MKNVVFIVTLLVSTVLFSQTKNVSYYKDRALTKEAPEDKALFKKEVLIHDQIKEVLIYDIKNNRLLASQMFTGETPSGTWKCYDENGQLVAEMDFSKLHYSLSTTKPDTTVAPAQFKGGTTELYQYLAQHLEYPLEAKLQQLTGVVYVQFTIDEKGQVTDVSILRGAHPYLDYAAYETIANMPLWEPANANGQAVAYPYVLPVRFALR